MNVLITFILMIHNELTVVASRCYLKLSYFCVQGIRLFTVCLNFLLKSNHVCLVIERLDDYLVILDIFPYI